MKKTIFLCGPLRSGSTLLRLMLHHHPDIYAPGEFDFLFDYLHDNVDQTPPDEFQQQLSIDRIFKTYSLEINPNTSPANQVRDFVTQLQARHNGRVLVLTVHRNFDRISKIFSQAHYIHLKRDPRDSARSAIGMGWAGNVYFGLDHWLATEKNWDQLAINLTTDSFHELKFEDLVQKPVETLTAITNFLEISYNPRMLDYPNNSTYGPPDPTLAYQWKRKLTNKEISLLEGRLGEYLNTKGYQYSGLRPRIPSHVHRFFLSQQNRLAKFKFKTKRYGLSLVMMEILTRHLLLKQRNAEIVKRMREINIQHLR